CNNELAPDDAACPHCGFKLLGSTQRFAPVALPDESFSPEAKPAAAAALRVVRGPQTGVVIQLGDAPQTIGRSPQCTIFLNDMTVSRMHATIEQENGCYVIRDANSFNGVWVNNDSVEARALRPGDFIQIGTFCMQYEEN
ncbi:MAG: FHA domain-containing protein, partial [Adlercreutzia equolifaciens]